MTRHFYAAQSPRGFANEIVVHIFPARRTRDAWVAAHTDDGDVNSATRGARIIGAGAAYAIAGYRGDAATQSYNTTTAHA